MSKTSSRSRSSLARLSLATAGLGLSFLAASSLFSSPTRPMDAFTAGYAPTVLRNIAMKAEDGAKSSASSVALVKVNDENANTTAGLLAGLAGVALGGFWLGAGLFAASSYLVRKENDDGAAALKGISKGGLDLVNSVGELNAKFEITDTIGSSLSSAISKDKSQPSVVDEIGDFLTSDDTKNTIGTVLTSAGDLASQIVDKAVSLNDEYKITDQISEKISSAASSATAKKA